MSTAKKILITSGIIIGALALVGWRKAKNLQSVFDKMKIKPVALSNFDISLSRLFFKVDISFENPSSEDFSLNGYVVSLKKIDIYYNGIYIGQATTNLISISVPANSTLIVYDIPVEIPVKSLPYIILQAITNGLSLSSLKINATVNALGKDYLITQD